MIWCRSTQASKQICCECARLHLHVPATVLPCQPVDFKSKNILRGWHNVTTSSSSLIQDMKMNNECHNGVEKEQQVMRHSWSESIQGRWPNYRMWTLCQRPRFSTSWPRYSMRSKSAYKHASTRRSRTTELRMPAMSDYRCSKKPEL